MREEGEVTTHPDGNDSVGCPNGVFNSSNRAEFSVNTVSPAPAIRWRSIAGVGLALLLVYGVLNVASAVVVPVALEARAVRGLGDGAVLLGGGSEEYMLGTTYAKLHRDNPRLDKLLVDTMLGMCGQMMAMAVAFLGIAWFAARRRARWAPWVLLVSGLIWVPYYFVIASDFGAFGAPDTFKAAVMVAVFAIPAVLGAVLMLIPQRRTTTPPRPGT
jgi:hypothetical protein